MINFVKTMPGVKRVAIVRHTDEWANAKLEAIRKELAGGSIELAADEVLDRNASDATTQVLKIKEAKPDAVLFATYPGESAVFLRDARKFGLEGPFVGSNSVMDIVDLAERAGGPEAVKNVYAGAYLKGAVGSPEMQEWTDLLRKYFPNERPQSLSFAGMAGAYMLVEGLRRAGPDLTREKLLAALEGMKDMPAGPSFCNITFSPTNHQGCGQQQSWALRDGKVVPLGSKWPGGPLRLP
jgi:branched-chain amino acid transport system substrate-binding protein